MLTVGDLHLEEGYLIVQKGKGGKRRRVGLTQHCQELLSEYLTGLTKRAPDAAVFLDKYGRTMRRDGLLNRLRRLGALAGIDVSPHALRRAFVTINANKGRSLVMLQMACGHSDIKTTRSYCKTSEDEMIQAMKNW
jgi:integrase/recombinase XerD